VLIAYRRDVTTTREQTIRAGSPSGTGWRPLVAAAGVGDAPPGVADAAARGPAIAAIAHLSDFHICDAESPARLVHLHRHGLPGSPYRRALGGDVGAYRPQEILTAQVAVAMVATINQLGAGPLTGRALDAAVLTGDLTDNAQSNEADWFRRIIDGGALTAASGDPDPAGSEWVGSPAAPHDPTFWHPHPSAAGDLWRERWGFPVVDGLLMAARRAIVSPGLAIPVLPVPGNHDLLLEGTAVPDAAARALAEGALRPTDLPPGHTPLALLGITSQVGPSRYLVDGSPTVPVTADVRRRIVGPDEFREYHAETAAAERRFGPRHSYTAPITTGPDAVRLIVLDTVNEHGGWQGSIGADQLSWLRATIAAAPEPYLVVATHHPSWTLINGYTPPGDPSAAPRVLADELLGVLLGEPRVVAWLAGHVHHHSVTQHRGDGDRVLPEITSAALLDWPQQSRTLEIVRPGDGTLRLVSTAIDHVAPLAYDGSALDDPLHLAALSRQLSRNVPRFADLFDPLDATGARVELNTTITIPDPHR